MNHQNILILDNATKSQIVILVIQGKITTFKSRLGKNDYVSCMIPLIESVLQENNLDLKNLDALIVGVGPGSYTGTRLAVLTAKMLAFNLQIPLYQISSILLLSSGYSYDLLTPLIDARSNAFFALSLKDNQICLNEDRFESNFLQSFPNHLLIEPNTIKIDLRTIKKFAKIVSNPHLLVPNYLTKTQAERNLEKND
ncbi:tRNA (adenosine(37)-N6)-threonylcarbamoyltransferase complex dimerization subunit type 1 TsaB [Candidatus Phytoplasma tritici]|uniref:tRNA (adenosine(37)-N6)-threonylcarbamoyltransferase complex dimerization subunit type 1 TsaB n=1 Tax=Candidatus Phytoplasma tritici TaxID=321961 RepID=UPI0003F96624|nr:tRNA (adenosine(37)-N6)-threonylcarbamoyltransferase complex dimerization subunit type 1 TsaB [Candidatus Phytoplasma tritici]